MKEYCGNDMQHPFFQGAYQMFSMFLMNLKHYAQAVTFWRHLEDLQIDIFGDTNPAIVNTYKQMGLCFLAIGDRTKSKEYFAKCIKVLDDNPIDADKVK